MNAGDRRRRRSAELVQQPQAQRFPDFVLARLDAAECRMRAPPRLGRGKAALAEVGFVQIDVRLHLVLHAAFDIGTLYAAANPRLQSREQPHNSSGSGSSTNAVASHERVLLAIQGE